MVSEIVYAIYHPDSGLFYNGKGLSKLNAKTKFYNSIKNANLADLKFIPAKIAWDFLEKVYNKPSIDIDISKEEYNNTLQMFRNLKVVPINLEYNQT